MPDDDNFRVVENMKSLDQSRKDVQGRMIITTQNNGICFTAETERNSMGWSSWNQARQAAKDRMEWRRCTEALCANGHEER